MRLEFTIKCIPPKSTHQAGLRILKRKSDGQQFIGRFATSKSKHATNELMMLFEPHRPAVSFKGPLRLTILWMYPYRKSEPKSRRWPCKPCDTRPDVDNIFKGIGDILTRLGFYGDDGQVAELHLTKCWNAETGIAVTLEELT